MDFSLLSNTNYDYDYDYDTTDYPSHDKQCDNVNDINSFQPRTPDEVDFVFSPVVNEAPTSSYEETARAGDFEITEYDMMNNMNTSDASLPYGVAPELLPEFIGIIGNSPPLA